MTRTVCFFLPQYVNDIPMTNLFKSRGFANTGKDGLIKVTELHDDIAFAFLFTKEKCPSCQRIAPSKSLLSDWFKRQDVPLTDVGCDDEKCLSFFQSFYDHDVPMTVPNIVILKNGQVHSIHPSEIMKNMTRSEHASSYEI